MHPNTQPAFPTTPANHGYEGTYGTGAQEGMTLRDYFAAKALTCLDVSRLSGVNETAHRAYLIADAMLKARETPTCD